jgi:hypothetical protein
LENYESNLTYLDDVFAEAVEAPGMRSSDRQAGVEAGFKGLLGGHALVAYVDDPARLADVSLSARRGVKLWDVVLVVVLLIALFEPWLANRISMRHYARPKDVPEGVVWRGGRWGKLPSRPEPEATVEKVGS